ncbi:hypothetical protein VTK73DRAFT_561 [Phialemonium thermophilum]|uniref:Major facilitator superfamily (MFS) profile domain-containing protein n=1 Tax=Phialemonium thermophilum TaxID=223376 RepID=A0ABR3VUW3_9PEZI
MSSGPNPSGRPESITMDAAATATGEPKPADKRPTTEADGATHKAHGLETGLLMMALCLSVFLAALDITIVTTALPTIATHFHSASGYVWVGSAFLLGGAAATPNWGKFSDVWGRKTVLQLAAATFFVGSALCGASVSLAMLIVGRAVQGVGAGGLLSMVNIIIGDLFSQRERGKYYGMIGMVWAVASALGPVVGGAFTNNVSWRWCFYINYPHAQDADLGRRQGRRLAGQPRHHGRDADGPARHPAGR